MMKKITLLCILLTVSFGYSQTLPFDFSSANQEFNDSGSVANLTTDPGDSDEAADPSNAVMEVITGGGDWDNVTITFATRVDLSVSATNSISFRMKATTDLGVRNHLLKFEGGANGAGVSEVAFSTEAGTEWQEFSLDYDTASHGAPGDYDKVFLFTDAGTGGLTGTFLIDDISAPEAAPETCSDGILNNGETAIDCGGINCDACDVTAPTPFTATAGTIAAFSVELLLNATDDSGGDITYDISYNAGANTAQATGASGVEEAYVVSGLTPSTAYTFDVTASDASGNTNVSTIMVSASTIADSSNDCQGFSTEALEGAFSTGYNYTFVTEPSGTDVTITFEILDTDKTGIVGEVFIAPSTFIGMTNTGGNTFTTTLSSQVDASVITFSGRFPYAGGLVRTKDFSYTVGDDCTLGINDLAKTTFSLFPNPTQNSWTVKTKNENISSIRVFDILGKNVLSLAPKTSETTINGSSLKAGLYFAQIKTANGISSLKLVKN
ncbi:MAG: T9SS type A sorting domain-containing protein [Algibacter sp.]